MIRNAASRASPLRAEQLNGHVKTPYPTIATFTFALCEYPSSGTSSRINRPVRNDITTVVCGFKIVTVLASVSCSTFVTEENTFAIRDGMRKHAMFSLNEILVEQGSLLQSCIGILQPLIGSPHAILGISQHITQMVCVNFLHLYCSMTRNKKTVETNYADSR